MGLSFHLTEDQEYFLGDQAQRAIETALKGETTARPLTPGIDCENFPEGSPLCRNLGSFVTLNLAGNLRGCIGSIVGQEPLYLNVWNMARAAAFNDPRFPPLREAEWPKVKMEISVLDAPTRCPNVNDIVIGRDGLILNYNGHSGVFLPQVPVEQHWNLDEYLNHLCIKAGVAPGAWARPEAVIYWYQAIVFPVNKDG